MVSKKTKDIIIMLVLAILASPFASLMYYVLTRDTDEKHRLEN